MRILLIGLGLLFSLPSLATIPHISASSSHQVFRAYEWMRADHPVIAGPVRYADEPTEHFSTGYYIGTHQRYTGPHRRIIIDYDPSFSAEYLFRAFEQSLMVQGFQSLFQCRSVDCGDAEAFKLFLDPLIFSTSDQYFYQIFTRNQHHTEMVAIYTVLIDSQVRVLFDIYSQEQQPFFVDLRLTAQAAPRSESLLVYFDSGDHELSSDQKNKINEFIGLRSASQDTLFLNLYAHTDELGSADINQHISDSRLAYVVEFLGSINAVQLDDTQSLSNHQAYFPDDFRSSVFSNRRVQLVVAKPL